MGSIDLDLDLQRSLWTGTITAYMALYDWNGVRDPVRRLFVS